MRNDELYLNADGDEWNRINQIKNKLTEEHLKDIRIAFINYIKYTYPNIKDNGILKHLKKFSEYLKEANGHTNNS